MGIQSLEALIERGEGAWGPHKFQLIIQLFLFTEEETVA